MKNIDEITIKDVHSLVDSKILQRGTEYFDEGSVINPTYDENEICAEVEGSSASNYKTSVKLERGKMKCECDCPYDWGVCKHVVALLLNWIKRRGDFEDIGKKKREAIHMSHAELTKVIETFAKEEPQMFFKIMDLAFPDRGEKGEPAPDFAKKAEKILSGGATYRDMPSALRQLEVWRKHIKMRLKSKRYGYVAEQLCSIIIGCVENYGIFDDSNGHLSEFVEKCFMDIIKIWGNVDENVKLSLIKLIWNLAESEEYGFEHVDEVIIKLCKNTEERDALRKPIIQRLVVLEEKGGKNAMNSVHYDYERVFDLALRLGYVNKKGVYLQD
jgi:hypothetical protein